MLMISFVCTLQIMVVSVQKRTQDNIVPLDVLLMHRIHTVIHVTASELIDAGKTLRCPSVYTSNIEAVSVALPSITVTDILVITIWVAMRVKTWLTASRPLDAS